MCSNSRIEWLGVFITDFTNAYTHILSLINGRQVNLLDSHKNHGGLIETYNKRQRIGKNQQKQLT